jgi:hypothetical protein
MRTFATRVQGEMITPAVIYGYFQELLHSFENMEDNSYARDLG